MNMTGEVVIIGAGIAGLEVAGCLAKEGIKVTLIEKENEVGGHLKNWYHLFPDHRDSSQVLEYLKKKATHNGIRLLTGNHLVDFEKKRDRFVITTNEVGEIRADAVVVTTGFDLFRAERKEEYGYGIYDDVITSADLEDMFRSGKIVTAAGTRPSRIGFVHCVGSRDEKVGNIYCSKLCCVTAVKQAMETKKHLPDAKVFCFYMDIRMGGALYEELYKESQEKYGITYIRGKVSEVGNSIENTLIVKVEDTLLGRPLKIELDMLVLMVGMEMSKGGAEIAEKAKLKTGENRFFAPADHHFGSNISNVRGVFFAGTCTAPMNITETISHARAAAAEVADYINSVSR